jgi:hypothetical protein
LLAGASCALGHTTALGFGQDGAFCPRWLETANAVPANPERESALGRWSWELVRRTSAPAKLLVERVSADSPKLVDQPFCVWAGSTAVSPLLRSERRQLRRFFEMGGLLFVDDNHPASGEFGRSVKEQLIQVLPESPIVPLPEQHVVFKSYYLVDRPVGRVLGPATMDAMSRGRNVQVLLSSHDLLGALAHRGETWSLPMEGGNDAQQRQQAVRLAVNIAMFVLCSDYKDDQVHAEELMRRRGKRGGR